jgi:hypothetical protein
VRSALRRPSALWINSGVAAPLNATSQPPPPKSVAGEPTPTNDARTPPSTAPTTPTSSRPVWSSPSAGMDDAIQPATTPKITQPAKPIALPFDEYRARNLHAGLEQVAHHARRRGPLGQYGLSPIELSRAPQCLRWDRPERRMVRGGPSPLPSCDGAADVARRSRSQEPASGPVRASKWVSEPISSRPLLEETRTHIVLFDRLSPWRKPHRSRAMRALAPAVQPPASGRGQRMRLAAARIEVSSVRVFGRTLRARTVQLRRPGGGTRSPVRTWFRPAGQMAAAMSLTRRSTLATGTPSATAISDGGVRRSSISRI